MKRIALLALLAATAALAGPYDQPYSLITSDRTRSSDPNLRPVLVNRVDDENAINGLAVVPPGRHVVTLDLRRRKGFRLPTQRTFELETRACVHYYVSAKLRTRTTQDWEPVVRREERLVDCERKFHLEPGAK